MTPTYILSFSPSDGSSSGFFTNPTPAAGIGETSKFFRLADQLRQVVMIPELPVLPNQISSYFLSSAQKRNTEERGITHPQTVSSGVDTFHGPSQHRRVGLCR
jgi:NAD(P)H-dependent FMN reductase